MSGAPAAPAVAVRRLLLAVVLIDVALVIVNLAGAPSFLDLDEEQNFTTWYSSAKLLGTALAALWCARLEPEAERRGGRSLVWPAIALLFTALSMDETATAHERLASALMQGGLGGSLRARVVGGDAAKDAFLWPVLLSPVAVAALYFLINVLWSRMRRDRRALALGLLGAAAFVAALLLEGGAVYESAPVSTWGAAEVARYRLYSFFEESSEVLGTTLMLASLLLHAGSMSAAGSAAAGSAAEPR